MTLFNILVLVYLLLIIAADLSAWVFNAIIKKKLQSYDSDDLPKHVYRKVVKLQTVKRTTRSVIRVLQVIAAVPIASAVIVAVGTIIIL